MPKGKRDKIEQGQVVGNLIFVNDLITPGKRRCHFMCTCGTVFDALYQDVKTGHTKSCGCMPTGKITHGMAKCGNIAPEFTAWQNMLDRCYNPQKPGYKNYGGRGIAVCDRWRNSFEDFFSDVGFRPSPKHSLDRYPDNNGNYEPTNFRWATRKEQSENTRRTVYIEFDGKRLNIRDWSIETGIHPSVIAYRKRSGLPIDKILFKGHLQKAKQKLNP